MTIETEPPAVSRTAPATPAGMVFARDRAERACLLATLAVAVYLVAFRHGAVNPEYWAYWARIPAALGVGVAARRYGLLVVAPVVAFAAILNTVTETA